MLDGMAEKVTFLHGIPNKYTLVARHRKLTTDSDRTKVELSGSIQW